MTLARLFFVLALAAAPVATGAEDDSVRLTAEQYTRAEELYWKVIARCCIRKPGALKIHRQIERDVARGDSDGAILADFYRRFGGGQLHLEDTPPEQPNRIAAPLAGVAIMGGWLLWRRVGRKVPV
jgi:hypothetical protein